MRFSPLTSRKTFTETWRPTSRTSHPAIAAEAVGWVKRLYAVEERAKALGDEARLALRQTELASVMAMFKGKLHQWRDQLLPKHPMAQAAGYALNQWTALNAFAADGSVPIDNNASVPTSSRRAAPSSTAFEKRGSTTSGVIA